MFLQARPRSRILIPAILTTIAYVDPGNFGTNIAGGTEFGFQLVWVVVLASAVAALMQYLAAKLGLVTGVGFAENCASHLGNGARIFAWLQAEFVVIMTDLAEIVGGALGLYLLFGIPLPLGAVIIGSVSFVILTIGRSGSEPFRIVSLILLAVVAVSVVAATGSLNPDVSRAVGGLQPGPLEPRALVLAIGIIGATVMPHAVYFHSAVSQRADGLGKAPLHPTRPKDLHRRLAITITLAMALAGFVNVSLLALGASIPGLQDPSIESAYAALVDDGSALAGLLLGVALLASGLASTIIGAWTGQAVMAGFLRRSYAPWKRRLVAMAPPIFVLALGVDPSWALVASQVALSFGLPPTLIALVLLTSSRKVMGRHANSRTVTYAAWAATLGICAMDAAALATL